VRTVTDTAAATGSWRLLRAATFRRYFGAQTVSLFGDQITYLALPLLAVLTVGAGPAEMGYLTAAALLPNLLFSLLAGAWVDRYPGKRRVMVAADLGRAAFLVVVPVLWWAGMLTLPQLYAVAFAIGTLSVFFEVAHSSLFAALVARPDYVDANALINGSRAMSYVAGPSVGGVLVQVLTAPVAILADAVSYLVSAAMLGRLRVREHPVQAEAGLGLGRGLRFVARSPVLRSVLLATSTLNLFNYVFAALFVLYVTTELGVSPGTLGVVIGAGAVGGLIGAAVCARVTRRIGIGPTLLVGLIVFPAPLMLVPLAGGPRPVVLGMLFAAELLSALGVMLLDIPAGSLQTAATPASMLALVQGAKRTVNYGIRPIGALIGGGLGVAIGVRPALWVASAGALIGVFWVLFSPVARMRDLPGEPSVSDPSGAGH
jgi:Na+/melibiose symporter-like transporter